jgi:molybdopterin-guanine dinucleotide biosynthesis protein A
MAVYSEISGFILAGGKSSRMGTDKAFLKINETPMLIHVKNLIEPYCNSLAISGYKPEYLSFNITMIPDQHAGCGPISGLYSCLKQSTSDWNLFVSVDTPFINSELLEFLLLNPGDCDCVIPKHTGGIEPSIGLYNRRILPVLDDAIKNGEYKLHELLSKLKTCYLDCNSLIKKYPRLFLNINKPEDYSLV